LYRVRKTRRRDRKGRPWVLRWQDPLGSGRERQETIGPMSERDAERHRHLWQMELNDLLGGDDVPLSWSDFVCQYLEAKEAELAKSSVDMARWYLARFEQLSSPRPRRLADVNFRMVEAFRIARLKVVDADTVRKEIRTLRAAFQWAVDLGHIAKNPFARIRWGRRVRKDVEALSAAARCRFLESLGSEPTWIWASLRLAILWGPRADELATLERADVDFPERVVWIRVKATWTPKAPRSRVLPLDEESAGLLQELSHTDRPILWGPAPSARAYKERLRGAARRLYDRLGIRQPRKPLHVLRATADTHMRRKGVPAHLRRAIIGHTSEAVSERHYDGTTPEEAARAVQKMIR